MAAIKTGKKDERLQLMASGRKVSWNLYSGFMSNTNIFPKLRIDTVSYPLDKCFLSVWSSLLNVQNEVFCCKVIFGLYSISFWVMVPSNPCFENKSSDPQLLPALLEYQKQGFLWHFTDKAICSTLFYILNWRILIDK